MPLALENCWKAWQLSCRTSDRKCLLDKIRQKACQEILYQMTTKLKASLLQGEAICGSPGLFIKYGETQCCDDLNFGIGRQHITLSFIC